MYKSPSCGLCVVFVWEEIGLHGGSHDLLTCRCTDERRSCYHCTICCYGYVCTILMFHLHALSFKTYMLFETCSSFRENRQLVNSDNITPKNKYHRIKILVMFLLKQFYISREYKESHFGDRLQNLM